ncbi:MAG: DUF1849 family protein [Proteobacteria bacterium]|nr:DUF1849 family protein [Pseudomonadota bacterium]
MTVHPLRPPIGALVSALASVLAIGWVPAAVAAELLPYRAIYTLKIERADHGGRFTDVTGSAVSSLDRTCDGWAVAEEVVMRMQTVAGGEFRRDLILTGEESRDGRRYSFKSRSTTNGDEERYAGVANSSPSDSGVVEFSTSDKKRLELPKGTVFFVGLTSWLVKLAESGQRTGEIYSFDGTDADGAEKVAVFVLPEKTPPADLPGDPALLKGKAWNVRMAFFGKSETNAAPDYEIAARLLDNGIVTGFRLIFKDFTVQQSLEDLISGSEPRC